MSIHIDIGIIINIQGVFYCFTHIGDGDGEGEGEGDMDDMITSTCYIFPIDCLFITY